MTTLLNVLLSLALAMVPCQQIRIPGIGGTGTAGGPVASFVQGKNCHWGSSSGVTETCTFTSSPTATDGIVVMIGWQTSGSTISSVVDGTPTTYANTVWATGAANCNNASGDLRMYSLPNSAGGAPTKTITVTWSADPGFGEIGMVEAGSVPTVSMVDKADCKIVNTTMAPASPSVTTTGADFLFANSFDDTGSSRTWTAGITPAYAFFGTNATNGGNEYFVQGAGGAVTGNFTTSANINAHTAIVGLKP
jgi:hypothetical protein